MLSLNEDEIRAIVNYCSEEVRRQGEWNAVHVGEMVDAWLFAMVAKENGETLTADLVEKIGMRVKPETNSKGFRNIPIYVGGQPKCQPGEIVDRLLRWEQHLPNMEPLVAYIEFEQIHPFRDGNGRTGKIILNWLTDTMRNPHFPPKDIWGPRIENP